MREMEYIVPGRLAAYEPGIGPLLLQHLCQSDDPIWARSRGARFRVLTPESAAKWAAQMTEPRWIMVL